MLLNKDLRIRLPLIVLQTVAVEVRSCPIRRGNEMKNISQRGLKTYSALRNGASHSTFLPPWIRQHLFGASLTGPNQDYEGSDQSSISDRITTYPQPCKLPKLLGNCIQSHIQNISEKNISDYGRLLKGLALASCPPTPATWVFEPGWTRYVSGCSPQSVEFPDEDAFFFDAEVCVQENFAPVLATAVSSSAWYSWVSPVLINPPTEKNKNVFIKDLVPLGSMGSRPRIVVGHYVCYDSARIQETYDLPMSGLKFFDTMAAHISVSGVTNLQRYFLLKTAEKPEWGKHGSGNSLSQVHLLYCGRDIDKSERDVFVNGSYSDIAKQFQELCSYCALDVKATHSVYRELLPLYFERNPHGASLAALLDISSMFMPVGGNFQNVVKKIKETVASEDKEINSLLLELAKDALQLQENQKYKEDVWLWDQDWSVQPRRFNREPKDSSEYLSSQNLPEWYRKFSTQVTSEYSKEKGMHLNYRRNIVPKLMQLCWGSYPLHWEPLYGWGMLMPALKTSEVKERHVPVESLRDFCSSLLPRPRITAAPSLRDFISTLDGITSSNSKVYSPNSIIKPEKMDHYDHVFIQNGVLFKKLPHYISMDKRVGGALSVHLLTNPCMRTGNEKAGKILKSLRKNVFWKKHENSFASLPIVWLDKDLSRGAVVPSASASGDFMRLPKENFFSSLFCESATSSGIKASAALTAPIGWCFLSANIPLADVWMASLLADSLKRKCGSSNLGQMLVDGNAFSKLSQEFNLTKSQAVLILHAIIWGANKMVLAKTLKEINPLLSKATAYERARALLAYFWGSGDLDKSDKNIGCTGVLSDLMTVIQTLSSGTVRTPILQSRLSRVLETDTVMFHPLIQCWLVRSSIADYLHVLMLCFHDLLPTGRLCSVGSQELFVSYLVPESKKYEAAMALHVAHLYSTAFCAAQVGLSDVPNAAALLPFVTLSTSFRGDVAHQTERLTFQDAVTSSGGSSFETC